MSYGWKVNRTAAVMNNYNIIRTVAGALEPWRVLVIAQFRAQPNEASLILSLLFGPSY